MRSDTHKVYQCVGQGKRPAPHLPWRALARQRQRCVCNTEPTQRNGSPLKAQDACALRPTCIALQMSAILVCGAQGGASRLMASTASASQTKLLL